jgi:glycosyltransferase involved in cell wall biosynthesis
LDAWVKRPFDTYVARRRLDSAIAVSEPIADKLRAAGFRGVEHVPVYALEPVVPLQPVGATRDIVYAGRLTPDKGIGVLVDAFDRIAAAFPDARLLVAGDGSERGRVAALGARHDDGRVQLLGRLDEGGISRLFAAGRVVVLPSLPSVRPEGSPLTAVEAALHGRPIVASDDPGLVEIVRVLGAGRCVQAGDPVALAAALTDVLRDDALATRWGEAARTSAAATYAPARVTERVRAVHDRVVRRSP